MRLGSASNRSRRCARYRPCRLQTVSKTTVDSRALGSIAENSIRLPNCFGITRLDQKSRAISRLQKHGFEGSNPSLSAN